MSVAAATRPRVITIGAPLAGVALVAAGAAMWGADGALRAPLVAHWPSWTIVLYEHLVLTVLGAGLLLRRRAQIARIPRRTWLAVPRVLMCPMQSNAATPQVCTNRQRHRVRLTAVARPE